MGKSSLRKFDLGKPSTRHRTSRERAPANSVGPRGLPQTQASSPPLRSDSHQTGRVHRVDQVPDQPRLRNRQEREAAEARQTQSDRSAAAVDGEGSQGGERGDHPAEDLEDAGGHHQDHEDEEEDLKRAAANGTGKLEITYKL